jgi:ribosome-binding protein aMBF1 (putative translation factor)
VTQEQIAAELRTLAQHQKLLLELDQMLRRIGTERHWSRTRLAAELTELEQRINEVERRMQMLLIEAAVDDDL